MESTIVLGWLLLVSCAHSDSNEGFCQRVKDEPEINQIVEYLRAHKEQVMDCFLEHLENMAGNRKKRQRRTTHSIGSYLDQEDIQWYLDNVQTSS